RTRALRTSRSTAIPCRHRAHQRAGRCPVRRRGRISDGRGRSPLSGWAIHHAASRDAPIATGSRFPIVLFSHGGAGTLTAGGSPLPYADLLTPLAREGFVVVAPFHPGSKRPLEDRPRQIHKALNAMLADPRF